MLSSTIGELVDLRTAVAKQIEATGTATAWQFETHAVAAGTPPSEQYLNIAATCDLFVLIVAAQRSDATEQEYAAAYQDNPEKILPFFLGDSSSEVRAFRALIEGRHTRASEATWEQLVGPITEAVAEVVRTGKILRAPLLRDLDARIERARTLIVDLPLLLEPRVVQGGTSKLMSELRNLDMRMALSGIGGSGKSLSAAITARRIARDGRTLSIYTPVTRDISNVTELLHARLDALRFQASAEILHRWGAEGRIFLVVDGVEAIAATSRRHLMESIVEWSKRYPRCGVIVCARQFADLELTGFIHASASKLSHPQLDDLLKALGVSEGALRLPDQVRDIAEWPLWAIAVVTYGTRAQTGLELLQQLVETRLTTAGMSSPLESNQLRAAAALLAFRMWPDTESNVEVALGNIAAWCSDPATQIKFAPRPAEEVLTGLEEAGLLEVGERVSFPHRLLSTILAAEYAATSPESARDADEELLPFVAALIDDDSHVDLLNTLLAQSGAFAQARYLRLSPPQIRTIDIESDVRRLAVAQRLWAVGARDLDVICGGSWIAWRSSKAFFLRRAESLDGYASWRNESYDPVVFWPSLPFATRTPEFVAALQVLNLFRAHVLSFDSGEDRANMSQPEINRLLHHRAELSELIIDSLRRRRGIRTDLLTKLGLSDIRGFRVTVGEPDATVWTSGQEDAWLEVSWIDGPPSVGYRAVTADWMPSNAQSLTNVLATPFDRAVYLELRRDIESALGCRLGAQSWGRPELVQAWAW
jgi:hypothetical protein